MALMTMAICYFYCIFTVSCIKLMKKYNVSPNDTLLEVLVNITQNHVSLDGVLSYLISFHIP